jgi:hypothetical protein
MLGLCKKLKGSKEEIWTLCIQRLFNWGNPMNSSYLSKGRLSKVICSLLHITPHLPFSLLSNMIAPLSKKNSWLFSEYNLLLA